MRGGLTLRQRPLHPVTQIVLAPGRIEIGRQVPQGCPFGRDRGRSWLTLASTLVALCGVTLRAVLGQENMDPQIRRWLIALIIGIALFAAGMASHYLHII